MVLCGVVALGLLGCVSGPGQSGQHGVRRTAAGSSGATVSPPEEIDRQGEAATTAAPGEGLPASSAIRLRTWDDLDAALGSALADMGWAVLRVRDVTATDREYELVSVRDEPGMLAASVAEGSAPAGTRAVFTPASIASMRLTCRLTRQGDAEEEERLVRAVRQWRAKSRR